MDSHLSAQQTLVRGRVVEDDSTTAIPFVYIISQNTGNGTMSDNSGNFSLVTGQSDTLVCSYVGALKTYFPVSKLKYNGKGEVRLVVKQLPVDIASITVNTFRFKPYERTYMQDIIDRSRIRQIDYATSPITALYMQFSKEGKQVRKLAKIFEDIFMEEQVQKKLNPDILRRLTGDENIDYEGFRKYCYYVDNVFIVENEGAELYSAVMECYRRYKREMR